MTFLSFTNLVPLFLTVPESAPVNLSSLPANTTALTVSWLPVIEEDRNGIILGYRVALSNSTGEFMRNISVPGSEVMTIILGGLEIWTNYSMQIFAFTVKGNGPWSRIVRGITDEEGKCYWYKIRHTGWQRTRQPPWPKQTDLNHSSLTLFRMFQCVAFHPTSQILYHVTGSCKEPYETVRELRNAAF